MKCADIYPVFIKPNFKFPLTTLSGTVNLGVQPWRSRKCGGSRTAVKFITTDREKRISACKSLSCNMICAVKHLYRPSEHLAHTTEGETLMPAQIRLHHKGQSSYKL